MSKRLFRRLLLDWYARNRRELPWRRSRDPYRVWISEVMLQQTRVAAVVPYYERFLARFPDVGALAQASTADLLAAWSGLGYYSRARNLQKAARLIAQSGRFPSAYDSLRALPGVGEYTAAAVASIAFGQPRAVVDGNVLRVLARLSAESEKITETAARTRLRVLADELLDPAHPGEWNQALMELGATVCLPRNPRCGHCPLAAACRALANGDPDAFPARSPRAAPVRLERTLLVARRGPSVLVKLRPLQQRKLAGLWDLPEAGDLPGTSLKQQVGEFRHAIVNHVYRVKVCEATIDAKPAGFRWARATGLARMPLTTAARKALRLAGYDV